MGRVSRRRKVANEIKDMLEAMEEDFVVEDELDEEIPEEELVDEDIEDEDDIDIEAMLADDDDDDIEDEDDEDDDIEDDIEALLAEEDDEDDEDDDIEAFFASEEAPGIEDSIQDTGDGGDPTVKEVTDKGGDAADDVDEDPEVFPTNSEYVAKITEKLDVIASAIEKSGNKKLALRVDLISDKLEKEYL